VKSAKSKFGKLVRNQPVKNTSAESARKRNHSRETRKRKKKKVRYGKATKRGRGKEVPSTSRSTSWIDCSRDADQASAEPDEKGPASTKATQL
jgi:hypothetical protein